jgi:alanine racemase
LRPAWLEIDLSAIRHNLSVVRRHVGADVAIIAIVKCNAYGHGAPAVAQAALEGGATTLAVAIVEEGLELRDAGLTAPVLVLGATTPDEAATCVARDLTPAVTYPEFALALAEAARQAGRRASCQVKIDSGMGRQGVRTEHVRALGEILRGLPELEVTGVFSHFASASANPTFSGEQLRAFLAAVPVLEAALGHAIPLRHTCASSGIILYPDAWLTGVRPGVLMYGVFCENDNEELEGTRPALSWKARISHIKELDAGDTVGYSRACTLTRPTRAAILGLGYGDGYPRTLSGNADVLMGGRRCPVLGRVSMDCTVVDVTDVPGAEVGQEAVLIGMQGDQEITAGEIATRAGTVVQEIVARLGARLPRVYSG